MEKIQSAIAKARAERGVRPGVAGRRPDTSRPDAPDLESGLDNDLENGAAHDIAGSDPARLWAALTPFQPSASHLQRNRILAVESGREAVGFDVLRTRLLQQMRANGWRRLAITSPGASSGKSTIALNLGFSLARQTDLRTLVCEMDLRRPSLGNILGVPERRSFSRVLAGLDPLEDHAVRLRDNLAVTMDHAHVPNSAELLQSPDMGPLLADIEARYDPALVIFDMPPMLVSDDTMGFMNQVDCVLLVAAAGRTTIKEIDKCEQDLASQTNVLGVVLNKCRFMGSEEDYGYYD